MTLRHGSSLIHSEWRAVPVMTGISASDKYQTHSRHKLWFQISIPRNKVIFLQHSLRSPQSRPPSSSRKSILYLKTTKWVVVT